MLHTAVNINKHSFKNFVEKIITMQINEYLILKIKSRIKFTTSAETQHCERQIQQQICIKTNTSSNTTTNLQNNGYNYQRRAKYSHTTRDNVTHNNNQRDKTLCFTLLVSTNLQQQVWWLFFSGAQGPTFLLYSKK